MVTDKILVAKNFETKNVGQEKKFGLKKNFNGWKKMLVKKNAGQKQFWFKNIVKKKLVGKKCWSTKNDRKKCW